VRISFGTRVARSAMLGLSVAAAASFALPAAPAVLALSALPTPTLRSGENIRHEVGIVNRLTVDRYVWRDSHGKPRSASLVRYGQRVDGSPRGGYAVQLTYQIQNSAGVWSTFKINPPADDQGDGGFGYFVSHENYRTFDANVCPDGSDSCPIATLHGEDDSPLGSHLPGTGSTTTLTTSTASHTFKLNYPHWGTVDPIADIQDTKTPSSLDAHKRYNLPATIKWTFTKGKDYPLITVTYDFRAVPANVISVDMRGPYGWVNFAPGNAALTKLQWGDQLLFSTMGSSVTTASDWTWLAENNGARYNLLVAGKYEFGLVQNKSYAASTIGSGYSDRRGHSSLDGLGCPDSGWNLPCDWEWTYQSIQYEDFGTSPTRAKKLAWGTAPYIGTTLSNDDNGEPFAGYPTVSYSVWLTFDNSGGAKTRALAASYH
jgi:hypothetical protein